MPPRVDVTKCTGCGICDLVCPGDVIHQLDKELYPLVRYPEECWYCGSCRADCPEEAISYVFPAVII